MRQDSDFAAYQAARWPAVVRTLVLLGGPQPTAEAVAQTALARCCAQWRRVRGSDDLDAAAYRIVLDCWAGRVWVDDPSGPTPRTPLEAQLDRLTPDTRRALVLRLVAGLSETQVAEVLDLPVEAVQGRVALGQRMGVVLGEDALREAADGIDVPAPPAVATMAEAGVHRRRGRVRVVGSVTAVLVVLTLATWLGTRHDTSVPGPADAVVARAENPADLAWWANGVLHLQHLTIELPTLTGLSTVTGGAVYGDDRGTVFFVADDGARTVLGAKAPREPFVVSDEQGWAAWVDPGDGAPQLVVYDLTGREVLARRPVPSGGSRPLAVDLDKLYYRTPEGDFAWTLPDGETVPVPGGGLLDVASATRARQVTGSTVGFTQPFFNVALERPGVGAEISADGNYALTRTQEPRSAYGTVHIYDTRTGEEIESGLADGELAIAARLGLAGKVTYVVARAEDTPEADEYIRVSFSGPMELRTCSFATAECVVDAKFPNTGSAPVLAG